MALLIIGLFLFSISVKALFLAVALSRLVFWVLTHERFWLLIQGGFIFFRALVIGSFIGFWLLALVLKFIIFLYELRLLFFSWVFRAIQRYCSSSTEYPPFTLEEELSSYLIYPNYTALIYFFAIGALISLALAIAPLVLTPPTASFEKNSAYECGFEPFTVKHEVFESHFLIVGILFLLFDLELIFLFPLAISGLAKGLISLLIVLPFLFILFFGFVFEWLRGALL